MSLTQNIRARIISNIYRPWISKAKKVLDVGCGNAVVSEYLRNRFGLELWGCDILDYRKKKIPFMLMRTKETLPFKDKTFDVVLFNDVLHHAEEGSLLGLLKEALRAGNEILIFEDHPSLLLKIFDKFVNLFYSIKMPHASSLKSKKEWENLLSRGGLHYQAFDVRSPWWYPLKHYAFHITAP